MRPEPLFRRQTVCQDETVVNLSSNTIHLVSTGAVTCRNHARLGLDRLLRGVYGSKLRLDGLDQYEARRATLLRHARAVMALYQERGAVLYGPSAFQAMGVALPNPLEDWDNCHILIPRQSGRPRRIGVITHRSTTRPVVWGHVDGLPLMHPVDHWLQLAGNEDQLVEVADGLLRRKQPILSLEEFKQRLDLRSGHRLVRRAARLVMAGTDSLYEPRLRLLLVRAGLPKPQVNLPVLCPSAGRQFHIDMGYEMEKLAVEYDGMVHAGNRAQMEIDARRRRHLQDEGWLVITITAGQLQHPNDVVGSVERALIARQAAITNRKALHSQ